MTSIFITIFKLLKTHIVFAKLPYKAIKFKQFKNITCFFSHPLNLKYQLVDFNQPLMNKPIRQQQRSQKRQRRKRNRYNKISLKTKLIFFRKVIHQNANFRQVAKNLGLKYSTAKTLIRNYKITPEEQNQELMTRICQPFDHIKQTKKRCTYRYISHSKCSETPAGPSDGTKSNLQFTIIPAIQIICNNIKIQKS